MDVGAKRQEEAREARPVKSMRCVTTSLVAAFKPHPHSSSTGRSNSGVSPLPSIAMRSHLPPRQDSYGAPITQLYPFGVQSTRFAAFHHLTSEL